MAVRASTSIDTAGLERAGFEATVAEHEARLLGRVALMVRDPQEAQDLVQETLLRAWRAWTTLRPDEVGRWLDVVAGRLAINEMRRRRRRPWISLQDHDLPAEATTDPDLWKALAGLSRAERVVIVLGVLGGYTHAEISQQLEVPVGTVSSWSTRGRQRLRHALANDGRTR
jgi:RNA polymerase sigma-70 factor (ECF subfamily)